MYYENAAGAETSVSANGSGEAPAVSRKLALKRKSAREYARRKREELVLVKQRMIMLYNELVRMGVYGQLSKESKEFFAVYINREIQDKLIYPPLVYKMFGDVIEEGVSCTLREAMQRLYKGKNEVNFIVRRWDKNNGVHIAFEESESGSMLDGRYVIKSIDERAPRKTVDDIEDIMSKKELASFMKHEASRQ